MIDLAHMRTAIEIAWLGQFAARPNPIVGAVLARGSSQRAIGWHSQYGDRHAERVALDQLGSVHEDDVLYVTLEPCAHVGKQPSCADLIIARGVRKVVVATRDPNPLTVGSGIKRLRSSGIEVVEVDDDSLRSAALNLNPGFMSSHIRQRPWVTYKWAMSADRKLATGDPTRRWISSTPSRRDVQQLRARSGAIMVGVQTVVDDDPLLSVRFPFATQIRTQPIRVVVERNLRIPLDSYLVTSAKFIPTLVATEDASVPVSDKLVAAGVTVWQPGMPPNLLHELLEHLGALGVNDVLVESGLTLAHALNRKGLIDRLICYQSSDVFPESSVKLPDGSPLNIALGSPNAVRQNFGPDIRTIVDLSPLPDPGK